MNLEQTPKTSIYQKIANVILHDSTQTIAKNSQGYSADQVLAALRGAMAENSLVCIPSMPKYNDDWIDYSFKLVDAETGESIDSPWSQRIPSPNGRMTPDKCVGAASTYAMKYFLMRTFMLTSEDDPTIDPNGKEDEKPAQSGNGNKPQPRYEPVVSNKSKELHDTVQALTSLKAVGKHKQASYEGKLDYDDVPGGVPVILFNEHLTEIDRLIGKDEGFTKGILDSQEIKFSEPLAIRVVWYGKGNTLKMAPEGEHPIGFDNPQVLYQFLKETDGIEESTLLEALDVDKLTDYKGGIYSARDALAMHLNPDSKPTGKLTDIQEIYRESQGGSVCGKKQKTLDNMPAVVED